MCVYHCSSLTLGAGLLFVHGHVSLSLCEICTVTFELLEDPVTTVYGNTFSRAVIEDYLDNQESQDPSNRQPLTKDQLFENAFAAEMVSQWKLWLGGSAT